MAPLQQLNQKVSPAVLDPAAAHPSGRMRPRVVGRPRPLVQLRRRRAGLVALAGGPRYLPANRRLPVAPLQRLNLKVSPAVLDHWRAHAAAQGVSIRDWLVSIAGPAAAPSVGPAASDALADRVAQLEAATAELREAMAQREARPPRSPRAAPAPAAAALTDLPADVIETADRAHRLGLKRGMLNKRIKRMGSPAPGLVVDGWRCVGLRSPERGDPPRALPVGPAHVNLGVMTVGGGMAGSSGEGGAGGGRYCCKDLSKQDAQRLLIQGHIYLGRDGDGEACEGSR
jgi:hypothetical protein